MKRNVIHKALGVLALSSVTLFAGVAQADHARINLSFGDFCSPAVSHVGLHQHRSQPLPAVWHDGSYRHDGFGPVSAIDRRQQHQRIVAGIRSGELTPFEARQLRHEQREIRHMERRYLADGQVSRGEWQRLDREQDEASHNIWRQKHDYQSRY